MIKFQFLKAPSEQNQNTRYTYLQMASPTFLAEKQQLLAQGFEVDGEPILAHDETAAVKEYRFGFTGTVEEYNKSIPEYAAANFFVQLYNKLRNKK
jgi:hypothetical protein